MSKLMTYKIYLYFSILLLITIATGVFFAFDFLTAMYKTSIPINSIIVTVVLGSIFLTLYYILSLCRDIKVFGEFATWSADTTKADFDPESFSQGTLGNILEPLIQSIRNKGGIVIQNSSDSRSMVEWLEQSYTSKALLVSFLGGFLVLLGLMGTFLGLTMTLASMGEILTTLAVGLQNAAEGSILEMMAGLIIQLQKPMAGMGTAFSTSLFGLAGSAIVGILGIVLSRLHGMLKEKLEAWLGKQVQFSHQSLSTNASEFPVDDTLAHQLQALSVQLEKNSQNINEMLTNTNKFLMEVTILQQRSTEATTSIQEQALETNTRLGLGNELSGRLIKECQQLVGSVEKEIENRKQGE